MSTYIDLIKRLRKQKRKIKDLPELIFRISFNKNRMILLKRIVELLEVDKGINDFEWMDSPEQRKHCQQKNRKILGQFRYQLDSPHRVFTVLKKS